MNINQHVPAGFTSWTEYNRHHKAVSIARNWLDGIAAAVALMLILSIDSIVNAIL